MSNEAKTILTVGYGLLKGTHEERRASFQKRLGWIRRGIGKPIVLVDIRKAGCGSINGKWFRQPSGLVDIEPSIKYLMRFLAGIDYVAEHGLANEWGGAKWQLELYADELRHSLNYEPDLGDMLEALVGVKAIAEAQERAVVLMCGCKAAFKKNGTTWNCHRVPLGDALVEMLGDGWRVTHL